MINSSSNSSRTPRPARRRLVWAAAVLWGILAAPLCFWGLPGRADDDLLFGGQPAWTAAEFGADAALRALRDRQAGADTDANPIASREEIIDLTPDHAARAAILLRYRLYSHQPDEMITFRALQRMKPRQGDFDPKLYQYGGAYIYGVGAAIGAASLAGAATLTRDLGHYLDHPADFARFYLIARLLSAAFAVVGLVACQRIAARSGGAAAGWLAMLLVGLSPVFLCGAVEAKPHIPSVCMTLLAIERGLAFLDRRSTRNAVLLGCCAGLAAGLVLTGFAALLIIPAVWLAARPDRRRNLRPLLLAGAVALAIYAATNPYVLINAVAHPESLRSNLGNSTAMYTIARLGEGALRVGELLWESLGGWMLLVGVGGWTLLVGPAGRGNLGGLGRRGGHAGSDDGTGSNASGGRDRGVGGRGGSCGDGGARSGRASRARMLVLGIPAAAMLLLCAAIGAGKPAEFARFLALPAAVFAIGAAVLLGRLCRWKTGCAATVASLAVWLIGIRHYPAAFIRDGWGADSTRRRAAEWLSANVPAGAAIGVFQEPAPYSIPPLDFADRSVLLLPDQPPAEASMSSEPSTAGAAEAAATSMLLRTSASSASSESSELSEFPEPVASATPAAVTPNWIVLTLDDRRSLQRYRGRLNDFRVAWETQAALDHPTPITWANKPVVILRRER